MDSSKKALVTRLLVFYLSSPVSDPDYVLQTVALEAGVPREDVWTIYCAMVESVLYS